MPNEKAPRGVKRKRMGPTKEVDLGTKLTGKLHHVAKEVKKAAKKAKTFETQKLVKKLKGLRAKGAPADEIADHEKELAHLKRINHEHVADHALKTKLKKDRLLSQNEHMKNAISATFSANLLAMSPAGTPAFKVENRLLGYKTIAMAVHNVIGALKEVIAPDSGPDKKRAGKKEDVEEEDTVVERPTKTRKVDTPAEDASDEDGDEDESNADSKDLAEPEDGWECGTVDGDGEGDEGWESGSIDDTNHPRLANASSEGENGPDSGDESSETDDGEDEDAEGTIDHARQSKHATKDATNAKQKIAAAEPKGKSRAVESTFLPSLSVGFTRGDSDASDWSDGEAKAVTATRNNRRGQRARRAIWEKKYGMHANHLKKERETTSRNARLRTNAKQVSGFQKRGGPPNPYPETSVSHSSRPGTRPAFNAPASDKGWPKGSAAGNDAAGPAKAGRKRQADDKPLHPSWEAKRRLKEKLNPSILPAQGKRIVF